MDMKRVLCAIGVSCLLAVSFGAQALSFDAATREFEEYSAPPAEETLLEIADDADLDMGKVGLDTPSIPHKNLAQAAVDGDSYVHGYRCAAHAAQADPSR
jgi:hypothetical protein